MTARRFWRSPAPRGPCALCALALSVSLGPSCGDAEPVRPVTLGPGGGAAGGGGGGAGSNDVEFAAPGPLAGDRGKGSFTFGAATAATQIEDQNPSTDWYAWTARPPLGLGKGDAFVGDASRGYSRAIEDAGLAEELGLDAYRFSVEWARVEPERDRVSEEALAHYDAVFEALASKVVYR